jgi:hypothetical protein
MADADFFADTHSSSRRGGAGAQRTSSYSGNSNTYARASPSSRRGGGRTGVRGRGGSQFDSSGDPDSGFEDSVSRDLSEDDLLNDDSVSRVCIKCIYTNCVYI